MRARSVAGALAVAGSLGAVLLLRRRSSGRRERIDLYLGDGSKVTLGPETPEFARLAALAGDGLRAAGA